MDPTFDSKKRAFEEGLERTDRGTAVAEKKVGYSFGGVAVCLPPTLKLET